MKYLIYYIRISLFAVILRKCVNCQDSITSQSVPDQNTQVSSEIPNQGVQYPGIQPVEQPLALDEHKDEFVYPKDTLEGNVLAANPVERLDELSRDISKEISQNPYYKLPELTRKIREIAVMHPDLMEKLGVYVIPFGDESKESEEQGSGESELVEEEKKEPEGNGNEYTNWNSEKEMRSEIDELMDKTEMMKAMSPEEKLEYIPQLKETIVYQILKNRDLLKNLTEQMGYRNAEYMDDYGAYGGEQGYPYYDNYQWYGGYPYYGNYQDYQNYPNYQYYQGYPNYQYQQAYPYGQYQQSYPYNQYYQGYY